MFVADLDHVDGPRGSRLVRVRRVAAGDKHAPHGIEPTLDIVATRWYRTTPFFSRPLTPGTSAWCAGGSGLEGTRRQEPLGADRTLVVRQRHRPNLEAGIADQREPRRSGEQPADVLVMLDVDRYA